MQYFCTPQCGGKRGRVFAPKPYWQLAAEEIYPSAAAFRQALKEKPLRAYLGIDPTSPVVHIGHAIPLRILRSLQEEGHHITLLIGSFTTLVGDPSGRDSTRPMLTEQDIAANMRTYKDQVSRLLDLKLTTVVENSTWYTDPRKLGTLREFLKLGHQFTAAQLWERDMFQERQRKGQPVTLTEFIYPVLQAYDFAMMDVDAQVGGTDQTFNMLAGRDLAKKLGRGEKFVLTTRLLRGTDGRKMSKSYNNTVAITDQPEEMFGKLMSIRDELIGEYYELVAGIDTSSADLREFIETQPREAKAKMASEVVVFYHGSAAADRARRSFDAQFKEGALPLDMIERKPSVVGEEKLVFFLVDLDLASSKSEATRLIQQGGVTVDGAKIEDPHAVITPHEGMVFQVGKRRFVKVKIA